MNSPSWLGALPLLPSLLLHSTCTPTTSAAAASSFLRTRSPHFSDALELPLHVLLLLRHRLLLLRRPLLLLLLLFLLHPLPSSFFLPLDACFSSLFGSSSSVRFVSSSSSTSPESYSFPFHYSLTDTFRRGVDANSRCCSVSRYRRIDLKSKPRRFFKGIGSWSRLVQHSLLLPLPRRYLLALVLLLFDLFLLLYLSMMLLPLIVAKKAAGALAGGILVLPPGSCILRVRQRANCPSLPRLDYPHFYSIRLKQKYYLFFICIDSQNSIFMERFIIILNYIHYARKLFFLNC